MKQVILNENKLNGFIINETAPIGTIIQYSGNCPNGSVDCNGMSLNRTDYARLFNAIGTKYGSDSDTTFKVPLITDKAENDVEYMTGKRNEDGKPIYYKQGKKLNNKDYTLDSTLTTSYIDKVIEKKLMVRAISTNRWYSGNGFVSASSRFSCEVGATGLIINDSWLTSPCDFYYEVYFTKATDTENTFCYNQLQGSNFCIKATDYSQATEDVIDDTKATTGNCWSASKVNEKFSYSTEEKVVGEWLEKPLYRIMLPTTFQGSIPSNWYSLSNYVTLPTNIKQLTRVEFFGKRSDSNYVKMNFLFLNGLTFCNTSTWEVGTLTEKYFLLEYTKTTD